MIEIPKIERESKRAYDQPDKAAEFFLLKRAPVGEKEIPVERYFVALEQMKSMSLYSTARQVLIGANDQMRSEAAAEAIGAWTPLGPGNIGGRTRALLIHPTEPNVIYAAGVAGGVWKTINGGQTWAPVSDLIANIAVCSLAMDPKNPEVIYAGTGEGYFNIDGVRGAGIFKTTDGGRNWVQLAGTTTIDFHFVNRLVISPNNNLRIYAATQTGVWRSNDGGASWVQVLKPTEDQFGGCLDLVIRTDKQTDYLFASVGTFRQATVYRNRDAGGSGEWEPVLSEQGMGRTSLAIAPSNQDVIYALSTGRKPGIMELNGLRAVYRSTGGGESGSWVARVEGDNSTKLNRLLLANAIIATLNECGFGKNDFYSQGWYNNVIAVDPLDSDRVWVAGTDLFRSDDGGLNWGIASHWWADTNVNQYAHADHHAIVFHPKYDGLNNKTMFVANDGGVFRTDDARAFVARGDTATCNPAAGGVRWTALNHNYGVTQFYHGLPFPDGVRYFGGTQDNGTLIGTDAAGTNGWREIYGGDGGYVAIDPTNPDVLYAENTSVSIKKSTDGGSTFSASTLGLSFGDTLFIIPFAMDPSNPQVLWTGSIPIHRTVDGAAHWKLVGNSVGTGSGFVSAIAVAPTDSNFVLVGKTTGLIHRNFNALAINPDLFPPNPELDWPLTGLGSDGGYISGLTFDPANKNIAYAAVSSFGAKHIWRSIDAGATWVPLDGSGPNAFPDIPAHCIVVDPNNTARLYVGTDTGVFVSQDGGSNWSVENTGFANAPVESLALNTVNGITSLYAFTHGRGAWRVTLGFGCTQPVFQPAHRIGVAGGEGELQISSKPDGCPWTAASNADWIRVVSGSGGGTGAVRYSVAPNGSFQKRIGTVAVGGRNFYVEQDAEVDKIPPQLNFTKPVSNGGTITTNTGYVDLAWTVKDNNAVTSLELRKDGSTVNPYYSRSLPENFSFDRLALNLGVNEITVVAGDAAGFSIKASIKVIFLPEYLINTAAGVSYTQKFEGDGGPALQAAFWFPRSATKDRFGNIFVADTGNARIRRIDAQTGIVTTVAGKGYPNGAVESTGDGGPALDAILAVPSDVKVDQAGNIYIAEGARIRKVTLDGKIDTIAGNGENGYSGDGGPAREAKIRGGPTIALDRDGNLLIADSESHRIRKVAAATGMITTIAGNGLGGYSGDGGPAGSAQLRYPYSLTPDRDGNLYIADSGNNRIRKIAAGTGMITTVAGDGRDYPVEDNALATATPLPSPFSVTIDNSGNMLVLSAGQIRKIGADGRVRTIAGRNSFGSPDDNVPAVQATVAASLIEADGNGNIFFADNNDSRIRYVFPLQLANGVPAVTINTPSATGSFTSGSRLVELKGTALSAGTVARVRWVSDRGFSGLATGAASWTVLDLPLLGGLNRVTVYAEDPVGATGSATISITYHPERLIRRIAGRSSNSLGFDGDGGPALEALLWSPTGIAADTTGNLYIADTINFRIRKVSPDGAISTFAGTGNLGARGDGGPAVNAEFNQPTALAIDAEGNLYLADTLNHRIRKISTNGLITTFAGNGREDFAGDGGPATAASLASPNGIAFDRQGNLYIADTGNNRIRRVDKKTGTMTTVAGNGSAGLGGDEGPAANASLDAPVDLAVDRRDNLFIVDRNNKRLRKVDSSGIISTFVVDERAAGEPGNPFNPLLTFDGIIVDGTDNLYLSSQSDGKIYKYTQGGQATIIAGVTYSATGLIITGDGGSATGSILYRPSRLSFDRAGNLYFTDPAVHQVFAVYDYKSAANVSAASYYGPELAAESIVAAFASNLATSTQPAAVIPLPTTLAGSTVRVRDSRGVERLSPLFFVSPEQINYQIPAGTAAGPALITITSGGGNLLTGSAQIINAAPGVFAANASGQGLAAAVVLRFKADGSQSYEPVAQFDRTLNRFVAVPIDLSHASDQVFLLLFGTGWRNRSALSNVSAKIGGQEVEVLYAGAQLDLVGLDQINLRLSPTLAGRGLVDLKLTVDGIAANTVQITIR